MLCWSVAASRATIASTAVCARSALGSCRGDALRRRQYRGHPRARPRPRKDRERVGRPRRDSSCYRRVSGSLISSPSPGWVYTVSARRHSG